MSHCPARTFYCQFAGDVSLLHAIVASRRERKWEPSIVMQVVGRRQREKKGEDEDLPQMSSYRRPSHCLCCRHAYARHQKHSLQMSRRLWRNFFNQSNIKGEHLLKVGICSRFRIMRPLPEVRSTDDTDENIKRLIRDVRVKLSSAICYLILKKMPVRSADAAHS